MAKMAKWQNGKNGKMAKWQNGKMAKWQNGKMANGGMANGGMAERQKCKAKAKVKAMLRKKRHPI